MTLFKKRSLVRPSTPKDIVDTMVGEGLETPALKQLKISNEIYMKSRTQKQISKSENGKSANPSLIASLSILAHSVPSAATAAAASAVSSPSPSVIPQKQVRKSKAYSKEGAGYVASQREVKFDQLIKTKDEIKKSLQILASNTAKNGNVPVAAVETKKEILESVNSRWKQQMMSVAADKETPSKAKAKKNITFNEKVTCHKISRIQDIIEEYDAFEEAFYNECEARFADLDASMGKSEKDVPIVDLSFTEESTVQSTEDQEPQVAELSVCEIMESATDGLMPQSISRMENFFQEARKSKYSHADSITSLGPACPTPDRCNSPSDINFDINPTGTESLLFILN